eukprot:IDg13040t1
MSPYQLEFRDLAISIMGEVDVFEIHTSHKCEHANTLFLIERTWDHEQCYHMKQCILHRRTLCLVQGVDSLTTYQ